MNRHRAHRMFIITSIYLLGIIVIMGLFLVPNIKDKYAPTPSLEELFPMLISNYSSYPYEGRVVWLDKPDKTIPIIQAEPYDTYYRYTGNIQEGSFEEYELGVFVAKKKYVVYKHLVGQAKPELYGPFNR